MNDKPLNINELINGYGFIELDTDSFWNTTEEDEDYEQD